MNRATRVRFPDDEDYLMWLIVMNFVYCNPHITSALSCTEVISTYGRSGGWTVLFHSKWLTAVIKRVNYLIHQWNIKTWYNHIYICFMKRTIIILLYLYIHLSYEDSHNEILNIGSKVTRYFDQIVTKIELSVLFISFFFFFFFFKSNQRSMISTSLLLLIYYSRYTYWSNSKQ
jgi:hypothetical protein